MTYPRYRTKELVLQEEISYTIDQLIVEKIIAPSVAQRNKMEKTMYYTLTFNRALTWDNSENVFLVLTVQELIDIYILRSKVYKNLGYDKEFPEIIEGMNFDKYDKNAAILYTQKDGQMTGTCRIIFDTGKKLPIDKNYSLDELRTSGKEITELSRLVIDKPRKSGLGKEFKYLTSGVFHMLKCNNITRVVSVIMEEHFSLYSKFGGFEQKALLSSYGELDKPFVITAWDITKVSIFFKKLFLGIRE
ncbi:MAG TPA: GNAT family N-acetyltransferase [Arcobacter sp.]|nr:GNAT family N-acetyltransferase [Arcobacter sp.]